MGVLPPATLVTNWGKKLKPYRGAIKGSQHGNVQTERRMLGEGGDNCAGIRRMQLSQRLTSTKRKRGGRKHQRKKMMIEVPIKSKNRKNEELRRGQIFRKKVKGIIR